MPWVRRLPVDPCRMPKDVKTRLISIIYTESHRFLFVLSSCSFTGKLAATPQQRALSLPRCR